jgi:glycosyltransferase involved in cell wall biosynthesis
MRVIQVSPRWFPDGGGVALSCLKLSEYFNELGYANVIIVPQKENITNIMSNVIQVPVLFDILDLNPITVNLLGLIDELQENFDVIILHSYIFEMNARIALMRKAGKIKIPVVLYFHGGLDISMYKYLDLHYKIFKWIYDNSFGRICFKCVDHIISVSEMDINAISTIFDINADKITYINNGVNLESYYKVSDEIKRVVFIGRLVKWKGVPFFRKIIESLPSDVELLIVGSGSLENEVIDLCVNNKNIKFLGQIPFARIPDVLAISDILILPALTEASPFVIMEAMAAGVPCISFSVGNIPNLIENGTGYLIQPYDINDFCSKLVFLLENDQLREAMGNSAKEFAQKNFSHKVASEKAINLLKDIITKSHGSY